MRIEECETCGDVTEHLEEGGIVFCSNCITHWKPKQKAATLYVCIDCGTRTLTFEKNGEPVALPVADCFRPDRRLVRCAEFVCSTCIPDDVAVSS